MASRAEKNLLREGGVARGVRIVILTVIAAIVIWLLFTTVFPWIESYTENPRIGS